MQAGVNYLRLSTNGLALVLQKIDGQWSLGIDTAEYPSCHWVRLYVTEQCNSRPADRVRTQHGIFEVHMLPGGATGLRQPGSQSGQETG